MVTKAALADATLARAMELLQGVKDPEIPTVSVLELGIIGDVRRDGAGLHIEMLPTFVGCPALEMMRDMIREALAELGPIEVKVVLDPPWTTQRITEAGREKLKASGFAPPPRGDVLELPVLQPRVACPHCGSMDTRMENAFGPTLCRAIHYCNGCRQPFEQFKAV